MAKISRDPLSGYTDTPAPLHSFNKQDSSMLLPTQDTFSKQFIPVAVLLAFLCLLLVSHLLRYPRILHIPPHLRDSPLLEDRQCRGNFASGRSIARSSSSLEVSLPKAKGTKAPEMSALYSRPTVRLVQGCNNHGIEARVRLIEEIKLPYSSPTLVGSSSDLVVPEPGSHDIPPRVYLPPTLPEIFDYKLSRLDKPEDARTMDIMESSEPQQATPLSSPIVPAVTGLQDLLETSPYEQISPLEDSHASSAMFSPADLQEPTKQESDVPISPDLSPPPAVLIHPILVRRALFPWRRETSPEVSLEAISLQEFVGKADPIRRHRPSVPSRLRYFITRSASISLSSSHSQSTPVSSLGKRSRRSWIATKSNRESSLSDDELHGGAHATYPSSFITAFSERAQATFLRANTVSHHRTAEEAPERPIILQTDDHPSFFESLSSAETSDGSVGSPEIFTSDDNENGAERKIAKANGDKISGWSSASEMRRASNGYRSLLDWGRRTPEPVPGSLPCELGQPLRCLPGNDTGTSRAEEFADGEQDEDSRHASETGKITALSPGLSLRTVFSRWVNWGYGDPQHTIEEGNGSLEGGVGAADESVEVMVLNRWAGLESV